METWIDFGYLSTNFGSRLMQPMTISSETRFPKAAEFSFDKFSFDIKNAHPTERPMNMR